MSVIENVHFYYGKITRPGLKYNSETEKEYTVDVLLGDKETVNWWKKTFKKQPIKTFDSDEFKEKFNVDPPFSAATYNVVKLKKPAQKKDGGPLPDIYIPKAFDNSQGKLIPIDKEFSNGAKGAVEYETFDNAYGTFAKLKNIRLDEWEEYQRAGGTELGEPASNTEFGNTAQEDDVAF